MWEGEGEREEEEGGGRLKLKTVWMRTVEGEDGRMEGEIEGLIERREDDTRLAREEGG